GRMNGMTLQVQPIGLKPGRGNESAIATGSVVRLLVLDDADEWEVTIVDTEQADPDASRISNECPIGEALLGRRPGDVVAVAVPSGVVQYRVLSVGEPGDGIGMEPA
ncbi:MAG TPA: GreA/GreB family elongation factor, partial [Armatimonadota bacterium]|nr:GreA/GreB family elongation factor [Armatimonadota bacterium]